VGSDLSNYDAQTCVEYARNVSILDVRFPRYKDKKYQRHVKDTLGIAIGVVLFPEHK
jgi:hypothetical protein